MTMQVAIHLNDVEHGGVLSLAGRHGGRGRPG